MNTKLSKLTILVSTMPMVIIIRFFMDLITGQLFWYSSILNVYLNLFGTVLVYFGVWLVALVIYFLTRQRGNPTRLMHLPMIAATPFFVYTLFFRQSNPDLLYWLAIMMTVHNLLDFYYIIGIYPRVGRAADNTLFYVKLYTRRCLWIITKNMGTFLAFGTLVVFVNKVL